jgi:hypothetical protein
VITRDIGCTLVAAASGEAVAALNDQERKFAPESDSGFELHRHTIGVKIGVDNWACTTAAQPLIAKVK